MSSRIFVVHDHELVLDGLRATFEAAAGLEVVGEAATLSDALSRIPSARPDVVVLDVPLSDPGGIGLCRQIRSRTPRVAFLMLTSFADDAALLTAIMAGAASLVLRQIRGDELVSAVRRVLAGASLLDPVTAERTLLNLWPGGNGDGRPSSPPTGQERAVLALIAQGRTDREIAATMHLPEGALTDRVAGLLARLGSERRPDAAAFAIRPRDRHSRLASGGCV